MQFDKIFAGAVALGDAMADGNCRLFRRTAGGRNDPVIRFCAFRHGKAAETRLTASARDAVVRPKPRERNLNRIRTKSGDALAKKNRAPSTGERQMNRFWAGGAPRAHASRPDGHEQWDWRSACLAP